MNETEALAVLTSIPYLGPVKIKFLIETFGTCLNILNLEAKIFQEIKGFGIKIAEGFKIWQDNPFWKKNLELARELGVELIPFWSDKYPKALKETDDYPLILYMRGTLEEKDLMSLAIVGTRQASLYGLEMARRISKELAAQEITIVSGLARGIDTAAHVAALEVGRTIAVIGSGLHHIYPKENEKLAQAISKKGVLISEFPMQTPPERQNFPRRNRIVSGMTLGTLLIEAPIKSGAMITMKNALSQKKKLFAIPGRVDHENFQGNHFLIKTNQAEFVETGADIYKNLEGFKFLNPLVSDIEKDYSHFLETERDLLKKLPSHEFSIEEAAVLTTLPISKLNVLLMGLMLKRAIKEYPGKMYKKIGRD